MNLNPDPVPSQRPTTDKLRAVVMTASFTLEGDLYFPRFGKEGRRLSNMLNSERRFVAMTNVIVLDRATGIRDPKVHPFIQVNMESVEFVQPYMDESEVARESQ
jgi:hypothetical protein